MSLYEPILAGQPADADRMERLDQQRRWSPLLDATVRTPNLGETGESEGSYFRQGQWINGWGRFLFSGTEVNSGEGRFNISMPVTPDPSWVELRSLGGGGSMVGWARLRNSVLDGEDPSTIGNVMIRLSGGVPWFWMQPHGTNTGVADDVPFTWADGDRITFDFRYPTNT